MIRVHPSPNRDRLSILAALVLLSYGLIRIVVIPPVPVAFSILGLLIEFEINTQLVMLSLAAAVTVSGTDWVIRSHPAIAEGASTVDHWIVPALASLAIGAIIIRLPHGPILWLGLGLAAVLLLAVLVGEFIVSDLTDPRSMAAALGLKSVAYLLLVGTFFSVEAVNLRAVFAVPLMMVSTTAVSWRLLRLETLRHQPWIFPLLIGMIVAQLSWAFHYWPLSPIKVSLILGLVAYLGGAYFHEHIQSGMQRERAVELGFVGLISLVLILLFT